MLRQAGSVQWKKIAAVEAGMAAALPQMTQDSARSSGESHEQYLYAKVDKILMRNLRMMANQS